MTVDRNLRYDSGIKSPGCTVPPHQEMCVEITGALVRLVSRFSAIKRYDDAIVHWNRPAVPAARPLYAQVYVVYAVRVPHSDATKREIDLQIAIGVIRTFQNRKFAVMLLRTSPTVS